jgi:transposase
MQHHCPNGEAMIIPNNHYAVLILLDDFNLNARQVSDRMRMSLRTVYVIKNRYKKDFKYKPESLKNKGGNK